MRQCGSAAGRQGCLNGVFACFLCRPAFLKSKPCFDEASADDFYAASAAYAGITPAIFDNIPCKLLFVNFLTFA